MAEMTKDEYKRLLSAPAGRIRQGHRNKRRRPKEVAVRRELAQEAVRAGLVSPFLVMMLAWLKPILWAAIVELAKDIVDKLQEDLNNG